MEGSGVLCLSIYKVGHEGRLWLHGSLGLTDVRKKVILMNQYTEEIGIQAFDQIKLIRRRLGQGEEKVGRKTYPGMECK